MTSSLNDLRGLRQAPDLNAGERQVLWQQLKPLLEACDWFTVGVMADTGPAAVQALRRLEAALGWSTLEPDPASPLANDVQGPAFLKGNQNTCRYQLRPEAGLGEGILITGHSAIDPDAGDTWGPFPLNLFDSIRHTRHHDG